MFRKKPEISYTKPSSEKKIAKIKEEDFIDIKSNAFQTLSDQARLEALFDNTDILLWSVRRDKKGRLYYEKVNEAFASVAGKKVSEYNGKYLKDLGSEADYRAILRSLKLSKPGKPYVYEKKLDEPGGKRIFQIRIINIPTNTKEEYYIGSAAEITELRKKEEELRIFAHAFESTTEMISITDIQNRFNFFNRAFLKTYGYTKKELLGKTPHLLGSNRNPAGIHDKIFKQSKKTGWTGELYNRTKKGKEFPIYLNTSKIIDEKNQIIGLIGVARDISELKAALERAEKEREKAQMYLDIAGVMLLVLNKDGKIEMINKKGANLIEVKEEDALGRNWFDNFVPPEIRHDLKLKFNRLMAGEKKPDEFFENPIISPHGDIKHILWHNTLLYDDKGKVRGLLSSGEDITVQKLVLKQLEHSLNEKDILLKEVYHRVKNNMQVISSLMRIQMSYIKDPDVIKMYQETLNRMKLMSTIHERFYKSENLANIDFSLFLHTLVDILKHAYPLIAKTVSVKVETKEIYLGLDKALPLSMILNELISNAFKYAFAERNSGLLIIRFNKFKGKYRLVVHDNGIGLPEGFDIKTSNTLGMQLVITFAEQIGGKIKIENSDGVKFLIEFDA
jgi:PAS domain S-box-containing protein